MSAIQVQLPEPLLNEAQAMADTDHVPLDEFVAQAVAERVAALREVAYLREHGRLGNREKFLAVLAKAPDVEPDPVDRIE